ncbi:MAG: hypothetical protein ACRCX2_34745 [Paraclostridium sp.]
MKNKTLFEDTPLAEDVLHKFILVEENDVVLVASEVESIAIAAGYKHLAAFIKKALRPAGWTGRYYKNGTGFFDFPHMTKLKHALLRCPAPTKGRTVKEDLSALRGVKVYDVPPTFKRNETWASYKDNPIIFCFYDTETTRENSFTGFKLQGYEFSFCPIYQTFDTFMDIKAAFETKGKEVVFVAFNDAYDGNIIFSARGEPKDLYAYRETSNNLIKMLGEQKYKKKIFVDKIYNPLSAYMYTFDAMQDLILTANSDQQIEKGSLKYRGAKSGLFWEHQISGDLFEYNKIDVLHTERLFDLAKGSAKVQLIKYLFELGKYQGGACAISSKLALGIYMKREFPHGVLAEEFHKPTFRAKYREAKLEEYGIEEDPTEKHPPLIYSKHQTILLTGGKGGVHSDTLPVFFQNDEGRVIYDIDFASFYPSIMIDPSVSFVPANVKKKISELLEERLKVKKTDKMRSDALKLFLNSIFGKMAKIDITEPGTICLVPLIAKCNIVKLIREIEYAFKSVRSLSAMKLCQIIDVNTDGIIVSVPRGAIDIDKLCANFTDGSVYKLEVQEIDWIVYRNSGRYVLKYKNGERKYKGSWVESSALPVPKAGGDCFHILNVGDIIYNYVEAGVGTVPKILHKHTTVIKEFGSTQKESSFTECFELPFLFNPKPPLLNCNFQKTHIITPGNTPVDENLGLAIALNKVSQCTDR